MQISNLLDPKVKPKVKIAFRECLQNCQQNNKPLIIRYPNDLNYISTF